MKKGLYPALILLVFGCVKEDGSVALPGVGACGSDGHRIELSVDGNGWCAAANVTGVASPDGEALITGLGLSGQLFAFQIDSIMVGDFAINEAGNAVTWTENSDNFTSTTTDPGTLHISAYDPTEHRIRGSVEVTVHDAEAIASRTIAGEFDVICTVQ